MRRMEPPRAACTLLRWAIRGGESAEGILGDLTEEYHSRNARAGRILAGGWFWAQCLWIALLFRLKGRRSDGQRFRRANGLDSMLGDLAHAARSLRRSPGFTVVTVGTLGLAIGVNTGIFAVVDRVLLDPLPFEEADRLVVLRGSAPGTELPEEFNLADEFYFQFRESSLFESVATSNFFTSSLRVDEDMERAWMSTPSTNLFATLGAEPLIGRLPTPGDSDEVAILSYAFWMSRLGGNPDVLGQTIFAAGSERTIIGVMGPGFFFPREATTLWVPHDREPTGAVADVLFGGATMVARLAPGTTLPTLRRELPALAERLPERFGGSAEYARMIGTYRPVIRSVRDEVLGEIRAPLWVLSGAVGIVLLIACVNAGNLFMVRAESRIRELAVRRAVGAGRGRLVGSLFSEAALVAGLAGVLAVVLAEATVPLILSAAPANVPRLGSVELGAPTLLFAALTSILCALACGLAPAFRWSSPELERLRSTYRGATERRSWGRDTLVAGQTALALILLICAGLLIQSLLSLSRVDPGYDTDDVFAFMIAPTGDDLVDGPSYARFHMEFLDRLRGLPDVEAVGIVENVPLIEPSSGGVFRRDDQVGDPSSGALLSYTMAGGDYFEAMGIDLLEGRPLGPDDLELGLKNVVVSRLTADLLWPGESPIGQRMESETTGATYTVVGVVEDVLQNDLREAPIPKVYLPLVGQTPTSWVISSPGYVVRTERAESIGGEIRALLREMAPSAPMYRASTMAAQAAESMVELSFTTLMLGMVSGLALILGAIGLYGVLSYLVSRRTREIGVRMALGAEAGRVRLMIVAHGARVVGVGVAVGLGVSIATTRALQGLLFQIEPSDPATFAAVSMGLVSIGLLASYVPARRASGVDPMESLRGD